MKIRIVEETYDYEIGTTVWPISDVLEVTEDEYNRLKECFKVQVLQDKDWFLEQSDKYLKEKERKRKAYEEAEAKRKAKSAETTEKRKLKQLEKLKKELGIEDR